MHERPRWQSRRTSFPRQVFTIATRCPCPDKLQTPLRITKALRKVKAHRGASGRAPENTLSAVSLAFELGADAVEIDVRLTSDDQVVVFHDADTRRVGGRDRMLRKQSLAQLRELDIGLWKGSEFAGERIATISELLAIIPEGKTVFVEIKDGSSSVPHLLREIDKCQSRYAVAIESFEEAVLHAVREQCPALALHRTIGLARKHGAIVPFPASLARQAAQSGLAGLSVDYRGITPEFAEAVRSEGLQLA
ncbi:MAG: hypothetical protein JKY56_23065, partial [Kofleriaceae bacterium]|nr:hypothetical protein [Kofleriaceae bacterium]